MNRVPCIVVIVALVTACYGYSSVRIIGGSDAPEGGFPYQVSLRSKSSHFCGGSILNERWILTAGHCVKGQDPNWMTAVVGTNRLSSGGDFYPVEKLLLHENYDSATITNDIGIIRVLYDIVFGRKVQPIDLPNTDFTSSEKPVVLSGWGRISLDYPTVLPDALQAIELRVISQESCVRAFSGLMNVPDTNICTLTKEGEGACHGDSGGPLTADGTQIGIVSWGMPCARGYPDVYTRLWSYVGWIEDHIKEYNANSTRI